MGNKNSFKELEPLLLESNPMPKEEIRSSILRTLDSFKFMAGIVDFYTEKFSSATNDIITRSTQRFYEYMYQNSFYSILKVQLKETQSKLDIDEFVQSIQSSLNIRKTINVLRQEANGLVVTLEMNREEAERLYFLVKTKKVELLGLESISYFGYYNAREVEDDEPFIDFHDILVNLKRRISALVSGGRIESAINWLEQRLSPDSELVPALQSIRTDYQQNQATAPAVARSLQNLTDDLAIHHLKF